MKKRYYKFLLHAPLAVVKRHLRLEGEPIFTVDMADALEASLAASRKERKGRPPKEKREALCAAIKTIGAHQYADDLLAQYKARLEDLRAGLPEGTTTEGISDDERAEVYAAWRLTPPAAGVRSGS